MTMGSVTQSPAISLRKASKYFSGYAALGDVDFDMFGGEIHMLLGENGAGKSTLVGILTGVLSLDKGSMRINGADIDKHTPANARLHGISVVHQQLRLADDLTVAENIFLGKELTSGPFLNREEMRKQAKARLIRLGSDIDPNLEVGALSLAQKQLVEIAKALDDQVGILLLDEPTASIGEEETRKLFRNLVGLKADGWAILYITHRMTEVDEIGDRVTVLRNGRRISTHAIRETNYPALIKDMVGREIGIPYPAKGTGRGEIVLEVSKLVNRTRSVKDVSLTVAAGEIVGVAGLVGSGKLDLAKCVIGLEPKASGEISLCGEKIDSMTLRSRLSAGLAIMPEDPRRTGLALTLTVSDNVMLELMAIGLDKDLGFVRQNEINRSCEALIQDLNVMPRSTAVEAGQLSGGNQQKLMLARALTRPRRLLVALEPTAGVDIGAKELIYSRLRALCNEGLAILMISSDLEEIIGMSDRVYVMHAGRIQNELSSELITHEKVVGASFGHVAAA